VTHDQLEALTMSDVIAVMDQGEIVQRGSPTEIYQTPTAKFVADFIGLTNFIEGKVDTLATADSAHGVVTTANGPIRCTLPGGMAAGDNVVVVIRPEDVILTQGDAQGAENVLRGKVTAALFMGDSREVRVQLADSVVRLKLHPSNDFEEGASIQMALPADSCRALAN
jgi:iron(III) transport system ATP-binding protein